MFNMHVVRSAKHTGGAVAPAEVTKKDLDGINSAMTKTVDTMSKTIDSMNHKHVEAYTRHNNLQEGLRKLKEDVETMKNDFKKKFADMETAYQKEIQDLKATIGV